MEAYLEGLLGKEDFAKLRPFLPEIALNGWINATHFVSLSLLSEPRFKGENLKSDKALLAWKV